jgi:hypothetical protein
MIHERRKVAKIVEELTIFFFSVGATKMNSSIEYDGSMANIIFQSDFELENRYKVVDLEKYFNEPKNAGMEDIYWELAGSGDPGETSQLLLVGMMIDKAEISITDSRVEVKMYKAFKDGY